MCDKLEEMQLDGNEEITSIPMYRNKLRRLLPNLKKIDQIPLEECFAFENVPEEIAVQQNNENKSINQLGVLFKNNGSTESESKIEEESSVCKESCSIPIKSSFMPRKQVLLCIILIQIIMASLFSGPASSNQAEIKKQAIVSPKLFSRISSKVSSCYNCAKYCTTFKLKITRK